MKVSDLPSGFTIFVLFFGVSLLEAFQGGNWLKAAFWLAIGLTFLLFESRGKLRLHRELIERVS